MPGIYRSMFADSNRPVVGNQSKMLGVRENGSDLPIDASGMVRPNTGGLSVVPEWRALPFFLIPQRLISKFPRARGNDALTCFRLAGLPFQDGPVTDRLYLRVDSVRHGTLQPALEIMIDEFQSQLAATRDTWVIDED